MKRRRKITLGLVALSAAALFVSGCTANFCTNLEKSRIAYAIDPGATEFIVEGQKGYDLDEWKVLRTDGKVQQVIRYTKDKKGKVSYVYPDTIKDIYNSAKTSSVAVPSGKYFQALDYKVYERAVAAYNKENKKEPFNPATATKKQLAALQDYGYVKYYDAKKDDPFNNLRKINAELREEAGDYTTYASLDFEEYYISSLSSIVSSYHSSITVYNKVKYGNYNGKSIWLEGVTWKDAWGKGGHLIEGLIVYPVAWMIDSFALAFAGGRNAGPAAIQAAYKTGGPQILSILIVTVIVRLFIFLCTFRSTLSQRKMTELQPELAKIQQKYPNANTNQAQKQRLAEEQMRLYKKHKVNPLSQLLVLIIQFPVFIGVWGAMTGSAVLSTGTFLNLNLSESIWAALKMGSKNHFGWWTAFVLIILMSAGQFFSMKVPQWIQKARTKKVARLGKNPAQKQQNRTANIISYAMLIMIIIMGFTLPAAMGVYWFIGAIVSLIQTVFTTVIFGRPKKNYK